MPPHFRSITETLVAITYLCGFISTTLGESEQLTCYQGTIHSNTKGQIPLGSENQLSVLPCGPSSPTLTTVAAPTTGAHKTTGRTTRPKSSAPPTTPSPTSSPTPTPTTLIPTTVPPASKTTKTATMDQPSRRRRDVSSTSYVCTVIKTFPGGSKLTRNATWVANFTCLSTLKCQNNLNKVFCCNTTDCNSLLHFRQFTKTPLATVTSCFVGTENSTVSQVVSRKCPGESQYCFNRTTGDGSTFGCSTEKTQSACYNLTGSGNDKCSKRSKFCCCASDDCNRPHKASAPPTHLPVMTTPYLVTASKHSSKWMIVLLLATGVLVGGIAGVMLMVVCRRWKRKQSQNGPLNISYSRISADCADDDDNIFSY